MAPSWHRRLQASWHNRPVIRFEAVLEQARGGGSVVELPAEAVEALGGKARARARGTFGGATFRSNTVRMGGRNLLGIHKAVREAAGVGFGERAVVEMEPDDDPREIEMPEELARALEGDSIAREVFEGLSASHRREHAAYVGEAKKPETRMRRAERTVQALRDRATGP
jgi:hypothetical protein